MIKFLSCLLLLVLLSCSSTPKEPEFKPSEIISSGQLTISQVVYRQQQDYNTEIVLEDDEYEYTLYLFEEDEALLKDEFFHLKSKYDHLSLSYFMKGKDLCLKSIRLDSAEYELASLTKKCGYLIRSIPKWQMEEEDLKPMVKNKHKVSFNKIDDYLKKFPDHKPYEHVAKKKIMQIGMPLDMVHLAFGKSTLRDYEFGGEFRKVQGWYFGVVNKKVSWFQKE